MKLKVEIDIISGSCVGVVYRETEEVFRVKAPREGPVIRLLLVAIREELSAISHADSEITITGY